MYLNGGDYLRLYHMEGEGLIHVRSNDYEFRYNNDYNSID